MELFLIITSIVGLGIFFLHKQALRRGKRFVRAYHFLTQLDAGCDIDSANQSAHTILRTRSDMASHHDIVMAANRHIAIYFGGKQLPLINLALRKGFKDQNEARNKNITSHEAGASDWLEGFAVFYLAERLRFMLDPNEAFGFIRRVSGGVLSFGDEQTLIVKMKQYLFRMKFEAVEEGYLREAAEKAKVIISWVQSDLNGPDRIEAAITEVVKQSLKPGAAKEVIDAQVGTLVSIAFGGDDEAQRLKLALIQWKLKEEFERLHKADLEEFSRILMEGYAHGHDLDRP